MQFISGGSVGHVELYVFSCLPDLARARVAHAAGYELRLDALRTEVEPTQTGHKEQG